jgi:hypothetical protein
MAGLAAVVGGVMRVPLTGVVFTLELTHVWSAILPLVIAATSAYAVSALLLKRSVLTEKIARRGLHLSREYSVDPPEAFFVRDVVRPSPQVHPSDAAVMVYDDETLRAVAYVLAENHAVKARVVARDGSHQGVMHLSDLLTARRHDLTEEYRRERHLPSTRTVVRRNPAWLGRGVTRRPIRQGYVRTLRPAARSLVPLTVVVSFRR